MYNEITYPFCVEYIDEYGVPQIETWSRETLNEELERGVVKVTYIDLSYSVQKKLGLVED